jgi:phosphatidylserine/phosphatidylglycerophosphate/cardiolipin synthase-like enzyme
MSVEMARRKAMRWTRRTGAAVIAVLAAAALGIPVVLTATASAAASGLALITEPNAGMAPIYHLLEGAKRSVDLTMYELSDPTAEAILAADAARGVTVRVLLDEHYEQSENTPAFTYLTAHRVAVRWAPSRYDLTHEKAAVIDGTTALVMTLNLTSQYYATTRDFAVVDTEPTDVAAIETVFAADWSRTRRWMTPTSLRRSRQRRDAAFGSRSS